MAASSKLVLILAIFACLFQTHSLFRVGNYRIFGACTEVNCAWGGWSDYGECTDVCGSTGTQTRSRVISMQAKCDGSGCSGPSKETRKCNRFCYNGGTPQDGYCSHCPDKFWGTCCEKRKSKLRVYLYSLIDQRRVDIIAHVECGVHGRSHSYHLCMMLYVPGIDGRIEETDF